MGVTYHQARKYENGINRIAAGRLFALAPALGVKIDYFFTSADAPEAEVKRSSQQRMLLDLSRNFIRMSRTHQRALCSLARLMAVSELKLVCASDDGTPHVAELLEHKLAG